MRKKKQSSSATNADLNTASQSGNKNKGKIKTLKTFDLFFG